MKILKINDCEVTAPPSTTFAMLVESESDKAFMAELVDLPFAMRVEEVLRKQGAFTETDGKQIQTAGQTPRIIVQSLSDHLLNSPGSTEAYAAGVLKQIMDDWLVEESTILEKAFFLRAYWF